MLEPAVPRGDGQRDMYRDIADAMKSRKDVERELSKLECRTTEILLKVKKAHETGEAGIYLTRVERNRLRNSFLI
jgi:hypothetical protein